ncbi:hypothetical protein ACHHYP_11638 [Achlya hypogyna]|uniref:Uncharacterized protein n=1 Tax=Achlya hypogyna TaxID=1202772 RepID=A0A1V9YIQ4_ACHHY|nr:hypothetical protein ACHHYP_11638 [Achlya hypogyna]
MELTRSADYAKENSPTIRRKLVFQGESLKQTRDARAPLPSMLLQGPKKKDGKGPMKRRALGDISNNLAADLHCALLESGKNQQFISPSGATATRKANTRKAEESNVPIHMLSDQDIELAHGGISKDDDSLYVKGLNDQLDAKVQKWKDEAATNSSFRDPMAKLIDVDAEMELQPPESVWSLTPPTSEGSPIDDALPSLFNPDDLLDFTLIDVE